jgi:hypothetical protein
MRRPELLLVVPITAANPVMAPTSPPRPGPRPVTPSGGVAPSVEATDDPITADHAAPAPLHSRPAAAPPPPVAHGSSGWQVVALAGSLGLLIGVSVWLIASSLGKPTVATAEPQPPNAGLTLTELAEVEPGPEAPPAEVPPVEEPVVEEPTPAPDVTKAPKPKAKPRTAILVKGDAEFVQLVGASGSARPGAVAPGTYTLFPSFSGGYRVKGPTVTVAEGQTLSFECKSATRVCDPL